MCKYSNIGNLIKNGVNRNGRVRIVIVGKEREESFHDASP